jgi:hypothetical protein
MRARYYNPYICRFINPDPIGFSGGLNWYVYADGNPVNYLDPYGLWSWTQTFGVLRAVGGVFEAAAGIGLGAATSWTGVGAVAGGVVAAHGLDQIQAGLRQAWTGEQTDSLTSSGLQAVGMSRTAANLTDAGISVVGSLGAGMATTAIRSSELAASSISPQVANAPLWKQMIYYEVGQKTLSDPGYTFYSTLWPNAVDRGAAIVADQGWRAALIPESWGWILGTGKTLLTGPTPLGTAATASLFIGGWAIGQYYFTPSLKPAK